MLQKERIRLQVVSWVPGRVRFKVPGIYCNKWLARYMDIYLCQVYGIRSVRANDVTASIIITYEDDKTDVHLIRKHIYDKINILKNKELKPLKQYTYLSNLIEKRDVKKRHFLIYASIYILLKIKQGIWGKFWMSSHIKILQMASLVTIVGGYPVLKNLYKKYTHHVLGDADMLLKLIAVSFTLMRESSKGVSVLILKQLNDYVKLAAEVSCEKQMLRSIPCEAWQQYKPRSSIHDMLLYKRVKRYTQNVFWVSLTAAACNYIMTGSVQHALSVLLVLCPSSSSSALTSGINNYVKILQRHGIYIKNPHTIDKIISANHVLYDVYDGATCQEKLQVIEQHNKNHTIMIVANKKEDLEALYRAHVSVCFVDVDAHDVKVNADCIILNGNMQQLEALSKLSQKAHHKMCQSITYARLHNFILGTMAFFGHFDGFTAKSLNTLNSLIVLLLNKRIMFLK